MTKRPGYGDAEAKRIIQRAAEIDAEQGHRLDAPALREIAAEAGISPLAVDRALQELESPAITQVPWLKRHRGTVFTIAALVGALLLLAVARITVSVP